MFQKLWGPSALQNVLLTTTQWSKVSPELMRDCDKKLWGEIGTKGAAIERFMGTRESGLELIDKLMTKEPKSLLIQDQMVENNMALAETDAGRYLSSKYQ